MKIKTKKLSYEQVMALPKPVRKEPRKPRLRWLVRLLSKPDLKATNFTYEICGELPEGEPALILMNHSSFLDLEMASHIFRGRPYGIVCTCDGFVGKQWLMRTIGCIPARKFVTDLPLIHDMEVLLKQKKTSVLLFPEASYSFDGTATPLPRKLGVLLKRLAVPVILVTTQGSFARDPLYNMLQKRQVRVHAQVKCLFTAEEVKNQKIAALDAALDEAFSFDNFRWQQRGGIVIDEPFRADGLNRILYRCPHCGTEGKTEGKGITLTCCNCGKVYTLTEDGFLQSENAAFTHIPDWYAWERQIVRQQLLDGSYRLDTQVEIGMMVDYKAIYLVGSGHLTHTAEGFTLTGCDGKLHYTQGPLACYSLYADYYWYELGDVICIGDQDVLYYCFPKQKDVVARTRLAVEELYKLKKRRKVNNP